MPFTTEPKLVSLENPDFKCKRCDSSTLTYQIWESSDGGHEDYKYRCPECNHSWWAEGSDY